ncbi:MAG: pitrilysin family protein [Bacteroidia bacterium]|nr:pitrilysin family protein [Bacteroidia bacterium]
MSDTLIRSTPPAARPLHNIPFPAFELRHLDNGVPVYLLPYGTVPVAEVQAIFKAGKNYQPGIGIARYTARNMSEGTASYDTLTLARRLDEAGAWLSSEVEEEHIAFKLAAVATKLPQTLPLMQEVLQSPVFPAMELHQMKDRALQRMSVNEQKTSWLAQRAFKSRMFGADHPYGVTIRREDMASITRDKLVDYHAAMLHPGNMTLTVTGRFDVDAVMDMLQAAFGTQPMRTPHQGPARPAQMPPVFTPGFHQVPLEGMQASLRLGHPGMDRFHPDYHRMVIVNTLLGGYFGSRLMKNIREEKGYTYGIYSGWAANRYAGYFVVQADVGNAYIRPTIAEVKAEMYQLMEHGASEDELELVRNYMVGRTMDQRETPFQMSDLLRYAFAMDLPLQELDKRFEVLRDIRAEEIGPLAAQYLKPEEMTEIVAGALPA